MANIQIRPRLVDRKPHRPTIRTVGNRRVIADGLESSFWKDAYFNALVASWPIFFVVLAAAYFLLNVAFASVYLLGKAPIANAAPGSFLDLFFFSVETTSTVGYGDMHPQTLFGHIVATGENFVGLVSIALMTGVVFARFSRPRARLIFARNPVILQHEGMPTLVFRIANARNSFISEATAKLWVLGPGVTREGRNFVGFESMKLLKGENPTFALSWTLFHPIDAESPLLNLSQDDLQTSELNFVLSISGLDETSSQILHSRGTYAAQDLRHDHEYVDLFSKDEAGRSHVDYSKVHETRPIASIS